MNLFELKIEDVAVQQMPLYFVSGKLRRTRNGQSRQDFLWKAVWDQRVASKSRDLSTRNLRNIYQSLETSRRKDCGLGSRNQT